MPANMPRRFRKRGADLVRARIAQGGLRQPGGPLPTSPTPTPAALPPVPSVPGRRGRAQSFPSLRGPRRHLPPSWALREDEPGLPGQGHQPRPPLTLLGPQAAAGPGSGDATSTRSMQGEKLATRTVQGGGRMGRQPPPRARAAAPGLR